MSDTVKNIFYNSKLPVNYQFRVIASRWWNKNSNPGSLFALDRMLLTINLCSLPQHNVHHCIPFPVVINPWRMGFSKYYVANKNANCTVLISWSLHNKLPHTWWLNRNLLSHCSGGQKSKIKVPPGSESPWRL